jgi:muramoyltetrapeptide carboxypeptidase
LRNGGTIGITAPASTPDPVKLERGVRYLEGRGYRVVVGRTCQSQQHYLAGDDDLRAAELMRFFSDPGLDAIFCARGGYGSMHTLGKLDFDTIGRSGKLFVGFSDITALQWAIWHKTGLVSVSAGMVATDMAWEDLDGEFESGFWDLLESGAARWELPFRSDSIRTITGFTLPGTASVAAKLFGTPWFPDVTGSILILEDVDEPKHKIEGYLRQFQMAGCFRNAHAVILGEFTPSSSEPYPVVPDLDTILDRTTAGSPGPVIRHVPYGHIRPKWTVPVGAEVAVSLGPASILSTLGSIFCD